MTLPTTSYPQPGTVHLWAANLAAPISPADDLAILSACELERMEHRLGVRRRRFRRAHAELRRVASAYCSGNTDGVITAHAAPPRAVDDRLSLSLSHSEDLAVIAVAIDPVGVDVEDSKRGDEFEGQLPEMADLTLSVHERAAFEVLPQADRLRFFLRSWTRKEAWLKATGCALHGCQLEDMDVSRPAIGTVQLASVVGPSDAEVAVALDYPYLRVEWKELR